MTVHAQLATPQCKLDSECASLGIGSNFCCAYIAFEANGATAEERTCLSLSLLADAASSGTAFVY